MEETKSKRSPILIAHKSWSMITNTNLTQSWRKLFIDVEEKADSFEGFDVNEEDQTVKDILNKIENNVQFAEVDDINIKQ